MPRAGVNGGRRSARKRNLKPAAARLVWAAGYYTDIIYLVPRITIEGKGNIRDVRLEARSEGVERLGEGMKWGSNPFVGTRELQDWVADGPWRTGTSRTSNPAPAGEPREGK